MDDGSEPALPACDPKQKAEEEMMLTLMMMLMHVTRCMYHSRSGM